MSMNGCGSSFAHQGSRLRSLFCCFACVSKSWKARQSTLLWYWLQQSQCERVYDTSLRRAASFAFGLATTLALLGVGSSFLGKAYGQIGSGLPIAISVLAIVMGLNLLEVVQLNLPSFDVDIRKLEAPPLLQVYQVWPSK